MGCIEAFADQSVRYQRRMDDIKDLRMRMTITITTIKSINDDDDKARFGTCVIEFDLII